MTTANHNWIENRTVIRLVRESQKRRNARAQRSRHRWVRAIKRLWLERMALVDAPPWSYAKEGDDLA